MLVGDNKECWSGSKPEKVYKGGKPSLAACANQCEGTASMFSTYGTCNNDNCGCYCEASAATDGSCFQVDHNLMRLYKYVDKGNVFVCYY